MSLLYSHPNTEGGTIHESHQGSVRTKQRARLTVYWPGMDNAIDNVIFNCQKCQDHLPSNAKEPIIQKPRPLRPRVHNKNTKLVFLLWTLVETNPENCMYIHWKILFDHSWLPHQLAGHYVHGPWQSFWPSDHSHQAIFLPHSNTRDSMVWWGSPISIQGI